MLCVTDTRCFLHSQDAQHVHPDRQQWDVVACVLHLPLPVRGQAEEPEAVHALLLRRQQRRQQCQGPDVRGLA